MAHFLDGSLVAVEWEKWRRDRFILETNVYDCLEISLVQATSEKDRPLQYQTRGAWLFTGERDTTHIAQGQGSSPMDLELLSMVHGLTKDWVIPFDLTISQGATPLCAKMMAMQVVMEEMPTCNDISIVIH
jgi:hypothetical protein